MSEKKIVVPRGMLDAALAGYSRCVGSGNFARFGVEWALEASFTWLSDNPIVPTLEQYREMHALRRWGISMDDQQFYFAEWQRRMFRAPDPDEPIRELLVEGLSDAFTPCKASIDQRIREAYRRGKEGK